MSVTYAYAVSITHVRLLYAGYIMDRRVGNTKKMGALFGILAAIGGPIPEPETIPYAFFILSNRLTDIFKSKALPIHHCMHICACMHVFGQRSRSLCEHYCSCVD